MLTNVRISEDTDVRINQLKVPVVNSTLFDSSIRLGREEIMRHWDLFREQPTYATGSATLKVWLDSNYPSLRKDTELNLNSQNDVENGVSESHILVDLAASNQLRVWNSAECSTHETKDPLPFIESILRTTADTISLNPSSCGLSVLGVRATEKGILKGNPQIAEQYRDGGQKIPFVLDSQLKRTKTSNTPHPLWEAVVSQPAAITPFHIDSHGSGHYIRQISGTKVLCACPCTPKNWEIIKPYYMQETPLDKSRSS